MLSKVEEVEKTVKVHKVFALKLISLFTKNSDIVCYSSAREKLIDLNNKYLLKEREEIQEFPKEFYYAEGSPLRYYDAIRKDQVTNQVAGIFETWMTEDDLEIIKKYYWYI